MAFKVSSLQHHLALDGPKLFSRTFCFEETPALCPLVTHVHMGAHYTLAFLCTFSLIHTHNTGRCRPHDSSRGTSSPGPLTHTSSPLSLQMTARTAQDGRHHQRLTTSPRPQLLPARPCPPPPLTPRPSWRLTSALCTGRRHSGRAALRSPQVASGPAQP